MKTAKQWTIRVLQIFQTKLDVMYGPMYIPQQKMITLNYCPVWPRLQSLSMWGKPLAETTTEYFPEKVLYDPIDLFKLQQFVNSLISRSTKTLPATILTVDTHKVKMPKMYSAYKMSRYDVFLCHILQRIKYFGVLDCWSDKTKTSPCIFHYYIYLYNRLIEKIFCKLVEMNGNNWVAALHLLMKHSVSH